MKRYMLAIAALLCTSSFCLAQQDSANSPATKEDVQKYLEAMHSREMMAKTIDAMMKPMHQMMHEQYEKDKDKLPADFEARMTKTMDDFMKTFPWDELLQSTVPIYQKHFTKGDMQQLVAFYSTPTGQKVIQELPAITAESMQVMMPMMRERMEAMVQNMQQQVAEMLKQSDVKPGQNPPTSKN